MSKIRRFEYIDIEDKLEFPSIELKYIEEFVKLAESMETDFVFRTTNEENKELSYFLFLHEKVFYKIKRKGFEAAVDCIDAGENGFPTAEEFYEARKNNFATYREYADCMKSGIMDKGVYVKAQKLGFVDNYDKFIEKAKNNTEQFPENFKIEELTSAVQLCEYAMKKGFKDYGDFQKAIFLGFPDRMLYEEAKEKGFLSGKEFFNAVKLGFDKAGEYRRSLELGIRNKLDYDRYAGLKELSKGKYSFDQIEFVLELSKFENGKKLSLNKLEELVNEVIDRSKRTTDDGKKILPFWYTTSLISRGAIVDFLRKNDEMVEKIGVFDAEGEYFEVSRLSDEKIYLDGSNVAYASMDKHEREKMKPMYKNIMLVAERLKELRFKDIYVIADASLERRVIDIHNFKDMKKLVNYLIAPSNCSADEFLIRKAKNDKCFIVSNDTFKDWKMKDTWVAQNIDKIRVPFMIIDEKASLPALSTRVR